MSILCINSDWMHCAHLGAYQEYLGSILYILFYDLLPDDAAANCRTINSQLKAYWRVHPEQGHFQNITLSMVRSSTGYPTLKGRAAEVKNTVRALRAVWDLHRARDPASPDLILHAQIDLLLQKFAEADEALDAHPPTEFPKLPPAAQRAFEKACWDMLQIMNWLSIFYVHQA